MIIRGAFFQPRSLLSGVPQHVLTRMPGELHRRRFRCLQLCALLCDGSEQTDLQPSVCGVFETVAERLLRTSVQETKQTGQERSQASSAEGAVSVDRCAEDCVVPLSWCNQIWQSQKDGTAFLCSLTGNLPSLLVPIPLSFMRRRKPDFWLSVSEAME